MDFVLRKMVKNEASWIMFVSKNDDRITTVYSSKCVIVFLKQSYNASYNVL